MGLVTFDDTARVLFADKRFRQFADAVRGRPIWGLANNPDDLRAKFSRCVQDGETVFDRTPITAPDGTRIVISHTYYPIGRGKHRVGCVYDVPYLGAMLSPRELECLDKLANGTEQHDLPDLLHTSRSSITRALQFACLKLNAKTLLHAIGLAVDHGLVTIRR